METQVYRLRKPIAADRLLDIEDEMLLPAPCRPSTAARSHTQPAKTEHDRSQHQDGLFKLQLVPLTLSESDTQTQKHPQVFRCMGTREDTALVNSTKRFFLFNFFATLDVDAHFAALRLLLPDGVGTCAGCVGALDRAYSTVIVSTHVCTGTSNRFGND